MFCNVELVRNAFATRADVEIVADSSVADLLWLYEPVANFKDIRPTVLVNQLPNEESITVKDLLVATIHSVMGQQPWLPASCALSSLSRFWLLCLIDHIR